jgi:lipopolysaccharide/colanic/teichoic acid biosynthesis glycosyltransferase
MLRINLYKNYFKPFFEITISLFTFVLASPLFIIISLIIKSSSNGPIIFKQKRIGKNGKEFVIYKFRTMILGSDNEKEKYFTTSNDKRITPIGKILRKLSLDELPQIFNVIKGNMSLIGPRPDVPEQKKLYTEKEFICRHEVTPGISGLSQVVARHNCTANLRKKLDIYYAKNQTFSLDYWIFFKTFITIFKGSY